VTLYLHRGQAHRGIVFHPILSHFMRFWLWLTTGMVTKEWVAVHRKHHRYVDTNMDPHSPHFWGIFRVLFAGVYLYINSAKDKEMVNTYSVGTPDDWVERNVYSKYSKIGFTLLLFFNILMFNSWGIVIWLIQMAWIPFWAAGVINGIGHYIGYRNWNIKDKSMNILPIGIICGGEEFHNNHHNSPASPKLSNKWWEFDIGWMWFNIFKFFKLVN
jgi:stearoyl-CoA desaturase (delta-9 desaturase)